MANQMDRNTCPKVNPGLLCLPEVVNKFANKAPPCDEVKNFLGGFQWIFSPFNTLCKSRDLPMIPATKWTVSSFLLLHFYKSTYFCPLL